MIKARPWFLNFALAGWLLSIRAGKREDKYQVRSRNNIAGNKLIT